MNRDPAYLEECRALQRAIARFPTVAALRAAPEWADLGPRLGRLLDGLRRYPADGPPAPATERVRVAHWNIEHGNWYGQVEGALRSQPDLAAADVMLLNEVDYGMARAGNRDVTGDLARALGRHAVFLPLFLETTIGRDDDATTAGGRTNQEGLFGESILSRWPIGEVRVVAFPSPEKVQFDAERMYGRHAGLVATIERPGAPFVAVSAHLEVHRTRRHRADQVRALMEALRDERRPIVLAGDFNTHTFDRGLWHAPLRGAIALLCTPSGMLRERLLFPDRGATREFLFDALRAAGFEWERFVDRTPTLQLRFDRLDEMRALFGPFHDAARSLLGWAERRGQLRLDWIAGRGWRGGSGRTVPGLDGPGKASDHAPIVADLEG